MEQPQPSGRMSESCDLRGPLCAVVTVTAGIVAAWFAAGAAGFWVRPLENVLVWSALGVAILFAWPSGHHAWQKRGLLLIAVVCGLGLMSLGDGLARVFAPALVLAAIAWCLDGLNSRIILLAALAAAVLAIFHIACSTIPPVWFAADALGRAMGAVVGAATGRPLWIGATFGAVDILVVMSVLYVGWLVGTKPPRFRRAVIGLAAVIAAQGLYLVILACTASIVDILPPATVAAVDDMNNVGTWTWSNTLHAALPWNLPVLAVILQAIVVAMMLYFGPWTALAAAKTAVPITYGDVRINRRRMIGALALAAFLPVVALFARGPVDLNGKTVVALEGGYLSWAKPEFGREDPSPRSYGMLPQLVKSLGGQFVKSAELSQSDLDRADVVLLIHPDRPWPDERLKRVLDYVRKGGSILVAAEPLVHDGESVSSFNAVLDDAAIRVRYDTSMAAANRWEGCLSASLHPAAIGIDAKRNRFGMMLASSLDLRWPADPILAARYGWCEPGSDANASNLGRYEAGKKLGDLVIAAEQRFGAGRIMVLGDTTPLSNDGLPGAYEFVGRSLARLADQSPANPHSWWRELVALIMAGGLVGLLAWRPDSARIAFTTGALAVSLLAVSATSSRSLAVMPDGRDNSPSDIAYIDASHAGAYSESPWSKYGLGSFCRVLERSGYLPLMLPELSADRLERAGVLISIAPNRPFSWEERKVAKAFVESGGVLVHCVGAQEAAGSRSLLEVFDMEVAGSPVEPRDSAEEPAPIGWFSQVYGDTKKDNRVELYAAWPITRSPEAELLVRWSDGNQEEAVVVRRSLGHGAMVLISDSLFAVNDNLPRTSATPSDNERFWRWLLADALGRRLPNVAARAKGVQENDTPIAPAESEERR